MATFKSVNYTYQAGEVQGGPKAAVGDISGRVRILNLAYTFAQNVIAIGDFVKLAKLPAGARLVDFRLAVGDLGTTGAAKMGWAASDDAVEAADSTGLLAITTMTSATDSVMLGAAVGFMKKFASGVDIQLEFTTATDAANAIAVKGYIAYVIDLSLIHI